MYICGVQYTWRHTSEESSPHLRTDTILFVCLNKGNKNLPLLGSSYYLVEVRLLLQDSTASVVPGLM